MTVEIVDDVVGGMSDTREIWRPILDYFCEECRAYWHGRSPTNVEAFAWELIGESELPKHDFALVITGPGYGAKIHMTAHTIDHAQTVVAMDRGSLAFIVTDRSADAVRFTPGHFFETLLARVTAEALYARQRSDRGKAGDPRSGPS